MDENQMLSYMLRLACKSPVFDRQLLLLCKYIFLENITISFEFISSFLIAYIFIYFLFNNKISNF